MTDEEILALLRLIRKYANDAPFDENLTVSEMVDDLAMSMDVTPMEADDIRRELGN